LPHTIPTFRKIVLAGVPVHHQIEAALLRTSEGIAANWEPLLRAMLEDVSDAVLVRICHLTGRLAGSLVFPDIARDGGANQDVLPRLVDTGAFRFLCRVCVVCPGILKPQASKGFLVRDVMGMQYIDNKVLQPELQRRQQQQEQRQEQKQQQSWMRADERVPTPVQAEAVKLMRRRFEQGRTSFGFFSNTGSGKTKMVLDSLYAIRQVLPPYIVWCVPRGVLLSAYTELSHCFDTIHFGVTATNNTADKNALFGRPGLVLGRYCPSPPRYGVLLVHHDQFKHSMELLEPFMPNAVFVFDEVHNALDPKTQRTSSALRLAAQAAFSVVISATPARNNHVYEIAKWLEMQVTYPVTPRNVLTAMGSAFSDHHETGIEIIRTTIYGMYADGVVTDLRAHMYILWIRVEHEYLVQLVVDLARGARVLLVASDEGMANRLCRAVQTLTLSVVVIPSTGIHVTPETVANATTPDFRVAITTCMRVEGYSLTTFDTMYTSVFYGNAFKRKQLEGRINRIGSHQSVITFKTFIVGQLMQRMSDRQMSGDSFLQALIAIEKGVNLQPV
jgi:hypothetical protein